MWQTALQHVTVLVAWLGTQHVFYLLPLDSSPHTQLDFQQYESFIRNRAEKHTTTTGALATTGPCLDRLHLVLVQSRHHQYSRYLTLRCSVRERSGSLTRDSVLWIYVEQSRFMFFLRLAWTSKMVRLQQNPRRLPRGRKHLHAQMISHQSRDLPRGEGWRENPFE